MKPAKVVIYVSKHYVAKRIELLKVEMGVLLRCLCFIFQKLNN